MKSFKMKAALTVVLMLAALFCAVPAAAAGNPYAVSLSVTMSNPKNNIPDDTVFTLVVEANRHAPLPVPAKISAKANGTYVFNPIRFTEPGQYSYCVSQLAPDDSNLIPDSRVYDVKVTVIRGQNGILEGYYTVSSRSGSGKADSVYFLNDYALSDREDEGSSTESDEVSSTESEDVSSTESDELSSTECDEVSSVTEAPQTGEPLSGAFGGLMLSGALFLLFLFVRKNRLNPVGQEME